VGLRTAVHHHRDAAPAVVVGHELDPSDLVLWHENQPRWNPAILLLVTDPLCLKELRVHELGRADGPTLVLLHGLSDSGLCWPDAVRRWRHDYRIVAPDARGHGESPRFDLATSGNNPVR